MPYLIFPAFFNLMTHNVKPSTLIIPYFSNNHIFLKLAKLLANLLANL